MVKDQLSTMKSTNIIVLVFIAAWCHADQYPPMENPNLFEGDLILSPDQLKAVRGGVVNKDVPLAATKVSLWPRVIPFDYGELKYDGAGRHSIDEAIKAFEKHTCLRFKKRTTEPGYLTFVDKGGCFTYVGYLKNYKREISLGPGCRKPHIAMHEMMHAFGFYHEQSRPDRDQYIKINFENMGKSAASQFKKRSKTEIDSLGSPYDFRSVMHYRGKAFSNNGKITIETLEPKNQQLIGKSQGLSKEDIFQLNKLYRCHEPATTTAPPPTLSPNCVDKYSRCSNYKVYCTYSKDSAWYKWVAKECQRTCGFCDQNVLMDETMNSKNYAGCSDSATNCDTLKNKCDLPSWKTFMSYHCKQTCGYCGAPKTTASPNCYDLADCAGYVARGYCSPNAKDYWYKYMRKNCIKSCGWCNKPTTVPGTSPPWPKDCGKSSIPQSRVIGGKEATPGSWPWQARIFKARTNGVSFCGASLISTTWLVTAAHCVKGKKAQDIIINLGLHSLAKRDKFTQEIGVRQIIVHPEYSRFSTHANDIALLQLVKPAILNTRVKTVCIPPRNKAPAVGEKCYITGWGKTRHPGTGSILLQQTDLPVVANSVCHALNYKHVRIPVTPSMLCAGYAGASVKGGCHGDSGGPFVCEENGRFVLHGAVSWGSGTCESRRGYTVFARIGHLREWIDRYIYS